MMFLRFWHNHRSTWRERDGMWSDRRFKEGPQWDGITETTGVSNTVRESSVRVLSVGARSLVSHFGINQV